MAERIEIQNMAVFLGEHADKVLILFQAGFFDVRSGSVTAHFDADGRIRKVEKHTIESF